MEKIEHAHTIFTKIWSYLDLKIAGGFFVVIANFLFGSIQGKTLGAIITLIVIDFITALYAARKTGEAIKSAKAFRTPLKIIIYCGLIASGHLTDSVLPFAIVSDTIIGFLAITELISILENASKTGFGIPQKLLGRLEEIKDSK